MGNVASPTDTEPTAHVSLKDKDNNILEFVLYSATGERTHKAIKRFPIVEDAVKFTQGESQYSDDKIPTIVQEDFSGGRGNERFEKDKSRFFDSFRMNTQREGIVLGGREIYATGPWKKHENYLPGARWDNANHYNYGVYFRSLLTTQRFLARKFTAANSFSSSAANVELLLKYHGAPSAVTVAVYSDSGGSPSTSIWSETISISSMNEENVSQLYLIDVTSPFSLTASTDYWLVVYGNSGDDSNNYWEVGTGEGTGKHSSNGSSWTSGTYSNPYFRISEDATEFKANFYEYNGQLYFASSSVDGSAGKVYMNGYRGSCDSNTGALSKLKDSTQSFSGFYDAIAKIVVGDPNALEYVPWRACTIDSGTQLAMDWSWRIEQDHHDEYVITGTDVWSEIVDNAGVITSPISDVAVGNGIVFLAQWGGERIVRHREFNDGGTWKGDDSDACWNWAGAWGQYIRVLNDLTNGPTVWVARNPQIATGFFRAELKSIVQRAPLPDAWGDGMIVFDILDTGQDAWDEQVVSNVTASFTENRVRFAITADFTTGIVGSEVITSTNLTYGNYIELTIQTGEEMSAGHLQLLLSNLPNCVTPLFTLNFPYLKKGEPQKVRLPFDPEGVVGADEIISIGLQITNDKNAAFNIEIIGLTMLVYETSPIWIGPDADNITGVEIYDDPERFWVFTESEIGYMQNKVYTPIPLREMRALRSMHNGRASCVAGVYLFFSMSGGRVMRYFRQNLDSIGPDRDAGLPENRKGQVTAMVSYPGDKVIIAMNGGQNLSRYSSILMWSGNGWHELYRSPRPNMPIRSLYVQSVDGTDTQRLWFSMGSDVLWIPITPNPEADPDYRFTHEGHVISSWIYANKQALIKVFHSLALFAENLNVTSPTNISIEVDYQLDNDTTWTALPSAFSTSPTETINLTDTANTNVEGRRIRFRYRFLTTDPKISPRMMASVLKTYAIQDIEYGYTFTTKLSEDDLSIDLEGDEIGAANYSARVEDALALMDTWAAGHYKLTMNTDFSTMDAKYVYMKPISMQPWTLLPDDQIEEQFLQVVVYEFATT